MSREPVDAGHPRGGTGEGLTPAGPLGDDPHGVNRAHAALLAGTLAFLLVLSCWLLFGWAGLVLALPVIAVALPLGSRGSAEATLRRYSAEPVTQRNGAPFLALVAELAHRAGLARPPGLAVIPSATLAAFTVGESGQPVIAVTEGLLRKLTLAELAGPLAHEIAHIRNGDLFVLSLADRVARVARVLSYCAGGLALLSVPLWLAGAPSVPWLPLVLLLLGPALASLLQLRLPHQRELAADRASVELTGSADTVVAALGKLEAYEGCILEDVVLPMRRVPYPSQLRSHGRPQERIDQLRASGCLSGPAGPNLPLHMAEGPMLTTLAGMGLSAMQPRFRWPGVWY